MSAKVPLRGRGGTSAQAGGVKLSAVPPAGWSGTGRSGELDRPERRVAP